MPQDESVVERAREYFFRHHRYTEEDLESDYQAELRNYRDDTWEAPQRAARLRGLTLSGTKTHVKQCFLPPTPLLMAADALSSPVLPA